MNPPLMAPVLVCGFSAIYTGLAQILSELYGKTILPLGPVKK